MTKEQLKTFIMSKVYENTSHDITGEMNQDALLAIKEELYNGIRGVSYNITTNILSYTSYALNSETLATTQIQLKNDWGDMLESDYSSTGTKTVARAANATTASTASALTTARSISLTGAVTGTVSTDLSGAVSIATSLATSGATAGTYTKVTVDNKGIVTTGASIENADLPTPSTTQGDKTSLIVSQTYESSSIDQRQKLYVDGGAVYAPYAHIYTTSVAAPGLLYLVPNAGRSFDLNSNCQLLLRPASSTVLGGVKAGANVSIDADGVLSVAAPTSPYSLSLAADAATNGMTLTTGTNTGTIGIKKASPTEYGTVLVGDGLSIDNDGKLIANGGGGSTYVLPPASDTVRGGIKVGSGLSISSDVLSVSYSYTLPPASTSARGGVKIASSSSCGVSGATLDELDVKVQANKGLRKDATTGEIQLALPGTLEDGHYYALKYSSAGGGSLSWVDLGALDTIANNILN
jgi:hypothetical protein